MQIVSPNRGGRDLRDRATRTFDDLDEQGLSKQIMAAEARLLALQLLEQGILPVVVDALRLIAHHDRDTAILRLTILLDQRLPRDSAGLVRQRMIHRADFEKLRPPEPE